MTLVLLAILPAAAGAMPVPAIRTRTAPVIDGILGEGEWRTARPVTSFTQNVPDDGMPASEPTRVSVLYDDEALYVGAEMLDSEPITARLGRRDADLDSDWFRVYLATQGDGRTGYAFFVNPSNVQRDAALFDDTSSDPEWDAVWTSATTTRAGGWTAEIRIPLSQLRFSRRRDQPWRVNFARQILRRNEVAFVVNVPRNESGFVSRFAPLTGIEDLVVERTVEWRPYATWRGDARGMRDPLDPVNANRSNAIDGGLDISWRPGPNVTVTGAIRPDFGQVEVDPASINLSEYELFFAEKRPLFLEGASLFSFGATLAGTALNFNISPPSLFYSRRIGREPQGNGRLSADFVSAPLETTILAAGKITGRTRGGWSIGLLDAVTQEERARVASPSGITTVLVEPRTNYLVLRATRQLGTRGAWGSMLTSVSRTTTEATSYLRDRAWTAGVDGHWRFGGRSDVLLEWLAAGTLVEGSREAIAATQRSSARYYQRPDAGHVHYDPGRTSLRGFAGRLLVARLSGLWRYHVQAQTYSPGFETNDAGFMQRGDITATHAALIYSNPASTRLFRDRRFVLTKFQNWNHDGDLISNGLQSDNTVTFRNYMTGAVYTGVTWRRIDDRATRGGPAVLQPFRANASWRLASDRRNRLWAEVFQKNVWNSEGGLDQGISFTAGYKPSRSAAISMTPSFARARTWAQYVTSVPDPEAYSTYGRRYVFARLRQSTVDLAARVDWAPLRSLSIQAYVQPYVAAGAYDGFSALARPRSLDYRRFEGTGSIAREGVVYTVDPDGPGAAAAFTFRDPDFNFRSLRTNIVIRWEYRPGSAIYVVWNENRAHIRPFGDFDPGEDLSSLPDLPADRTLLVKATYRFQH